MYMHVNSTLYIEPCANLTHKLQCIIAVIRKESKTPRGPEQVPQQDELYLEVLSVHLQSNLW